MSEGRDLVVLVADLDAEKTLEGLLQRPQSLDIRAVNYTILRHINRDNGCWNEADLFLKSQASLYRHALVVFDHAGSGQENQAVEDLQTKLEKRLQHKGWDGDRAGVVIIQPELEAWIWSDSPHVDVVLGWAGQTPDLRAWLHEQTYLHGDQVKPDDPKAAFEAALRRVNKRRSAAIYSDLAGKVSVQRCTDPAFQHLKSLLQRWFAP